MKHFTEGLNRTVFLILLGIVLFNNSAFCASKKKKAAAEESKQVKATYQKEEKKTKNQSKEEKETKEEEKKEPESVVLTTQKRTFFYKIEPEIVTGVENGSPDSLRLAMSKIRKNESEYEPNEKILIAIATEMMKTIWTSEKITWESFYVTDDNSYIGAIDSANKGVFDSSTGNTDFLSTLLPAIVLLKPAATSEVIEPCENALKSALSRNSNSVVANYLMGVLLTKTKQNSQAEQFYRKAYENSRSTKEIILAYSECLRKNGNLDLAYQILSTINNMDLDVLKQNAYLAFAQKNISAAEEYVARVLQQNPNDLEFVLFRAKILIEKNDYIHAVSLLDVYARQDNSSLDYLLLRAKVQLDWSKNTVAATETVEKAFASYPDSLEVLMFAARISSTTDLPVAGFYADELAQKILAEDSNNKEALNYALDGLIQRKNWQESYDICQLLIQKGEVNPEVVSKFVKICINLSREDEAFDYASKMREQFPNDEQILQAYIYSYSQVGTKEEVIRFIDTLITTASPKLKSYLCYRRSYLQITEDAQLADLRSSLISNPRNGDALFRLYEIYFTKKDYRKAQYYLRQVVAINPNDTNAKKLNEELTSLMN